MSRYAQQDAEWRGVRDELIDAGEKPSAYRVTTELRKRLLARGETLMTYEEILEEHAREVASGAL